MGPSNSHPPWPYLGLILVLRAVTNIDTRHSFQSSNAQLQLDGSKHVKSGHQQACWNSRGSVARLGQVSMLPITVSTAVMRMRGYPKPSAPHPTRILCHRPAGRQQPINNQREEVKRSFLTTYLPPLPLTFRNPIFCSPIKVTIYLHLRITLNRPHPF